MIRWKPSIVLGHIVIGKVKILTKILSELQFKRQLELHRLGNINIYTEVDTYG